MLFTPGTHLHDCTSKQDWGNSSVIEPFPQHVQHSRFRGSVPNKKRNGTNERKNEEGLGVGGKAGRQPPRSLRRAAGVQ